MALILLSQPSPTTLYFSSPNNDAATKFSSPDSESIGNEKSPGIIFHEYVDKLGETTNNLIFLSRKHSIRPLKFFKSFDIIIWPSKSKRTANSSAHTNLHPHLYLVLQSCRNRLHIHTHGRRGPGGPARREA